MHEHNHFLGNSLFLRVLIVQPVGCTYDWPAVRLHVFSIIAHIFTRVQPVLSLQGKATARIWQDRYIA